MVRFEKDKLVIEIVTAFPEEYVVELQRDLLRLMRAADKDMIDNDNDSVAGVCSFLEDLLAPAGAGDRMRRDESRLYEGGGVAPLRTGCEALQPHNRANYHE